MNRRAAAFWVGLAVVLVLIGLLAGRQDRVDGASLDPAATNEEGTAALVTLLDELGSTVDRGLPSDDTATALILVDRLDEDQRAQVEAWVEQGGTLVVADQFSAFAPRSPLAFAPGTLDDPACPLSGLAGLEITGGTLLLFSAEPVPGAGGSPDGPVPPFGIDGSCFSTGDGDFVQVDNRGLGRVIALGGADPLTNRYIDEADNAVLAVQLLTKGGQVSGPVSVLFGPVFAPGSRGLRDLLPTGLTWAGWQLLIAFVLFVLWRARRFGSPVVEPQPVELPGSLLVRATGELHRRSGGTAEASAVLRADLEARLRRELKLSAETPLSDVAAQACRSGGLDPSIANRALSGPPATTGGELAALLGDIDTVNRTLAATGTGSISAGTGELL